MPSADIPVPVDDGACDHLPGTSLPAVSLPPCSNPSNPVDLASLKGLTVIFTYPRTATPGEPKNEAWAAVPGASGCTAQACSFRDGISDLRDVNVDHVYGLSVQDSAYQHEAQVRNKLPYELLSDEHLTLAKALKLPTLEWQGNHLLKRLSLVVHNGKIVKVFYPVFPPGENATQVVQWLKSSDAEAILAA